MGLHVTATTGVGDDGCSEFQAEGKGVISAFAGAQLDRELGHGDLTSK